MKLKKYLIFFLSLFLLSGFLILNNAISGQIFKNKRVENKEIVKEFSKLYYKDKVDKGTYWISLPEKISSKLKTPIIILLHGGVFNNSDHGYVFSRIFRSVLKHDNVIFVAPTMPVSSYPRWRKKDESFIKHVLRKVKRDYRINPLSPVYFGGFSNGAEVALKLVLSEQIKVKGVFAFAGGCRLVWNNIDDNVDRNIPVFLSSGHKDGNWLGSTVASYKHLKSKKFSNVIIKGFPHVEHWIDRKQVYELFKWVKENTYQNGNV